MSGYIDYPETSGLVSSGSIASAGSNNPYDPGPPFVHPLAYVHETATLGRGTKVWQFASVMAGAVIGDNCAVGPSAFVGVEARLGNHVRIQHAAHLTDHMVVGSYVFWGNGAQSGNDKHPVVNNPGFKREPPVVEDDVSIGTNATLCPGVRLGRGCMVGAGAVVTKDVEPFTTVAGVPARELRAQQAPGAQAPWLPGWVQGTTP